MVAEEPTVAGARLAGTRTRAALLAVAVLVFATRAPFVPPSLEDYDSVNFARALLDYDPVAHRPHPPGYPVFVALARAVNALFPQPERALGLLSAGAQALAVFPAFAVLTALAPSRAVAAAALAILFSCPVLWFNGARPMSDSAGLLFALLVQALLLRHLDSGRGMLLGSFLAGLGAGVRLQSLLLTGPLWLLVARRRRPRVGALLSGALGVLVWLIPMLILSGGPQRYLAAFTDTMTMALDLEPLATHLTPNTVVRAAGLVLIAPWRWPQLGAVILALAGLGSMVLGMREPRRLILAAVLFGPYLAGHVLLQQVEAIRYTLPYLPLFAFLAAAGLSALAARVAPRAPERATLGFAATLATAGAAATLPALWLYSRALSPPAAAVRAATGMGAGPGRYVLAAQHVFDPYLSQLPGGRELLPSLPPPARNLVRIKQYWLEGGRKDVLFIASGRRTDRASVDWRAQRTLGEWRWPAAVGALLSGQRPRSAELLLLSPPNWFASRGYLLSLEASPVAASAVMPERVAHLLARHEPTFLLVAGEPASAAPEGTIDFTLVEEPVLSAPCGAALLEGVELPPGGPAEGQYVELVGRLHCGSAGAPAPFLLRGLDYGPRSEPGVAHGQGWHYPERDESRRLFRWTGARARSIVHVPAGGAALTVDGEASFAHVGPGGSIRLLVDGVRVAGLQLAEPVFRLATRLPPGRPFREVVIETDRTFVPDRLQRNGDERSLGVRIYGFRLAAARGETPTGTH